MSFYYPLELVSLLLVGVARSVRSLVHGDIHDESILGFVMRRIPIRDVSTSSGVEVDRGGVPSGRTTLVR